MIIKLLYIVLSIFIIIKFLFPFVDEIKDTKTQIALINNSIKKQNFLINKQQKINMIYNKSLQITKQNNKLFFINKKDSVIFSNLQNIIKNIANKYNINIDSIKWGYSVSNKYYISYPLDIKFKTTPQKFSKFIDDLCKIDKFFTISFIKIKEKNKYSSKLIYHIILNGYKIKGKI